MANFLIVVPCVGETAAARRRFDHGLRLMQAFKSLTPNGTLETDFAQVASFGRLNGSGTPVQHDPRTGNWLLAIGTWFHADGLGPGDEAALLQRFNAVGADRLAGELEGFFAIAAGNAASGEVHLIVDVVGTLHCYVRQLDDAVVISASSLVLAGLEDVTLDAVACQEFLQTGAMYEDRTFFNEVRKLDASRCFTYAGGRLRREHRYWHASDLKPDSLHGDASVSAMRQAMAQAARRIGKAFPKPAVDLTGGYDSRGGVAAFLDAGVPFETAVAGMSGEADIEVSRSLAAELGLKHRVFQPGSVTRFEQLRKALEFTDGEFDIVDYARILEVQSDLAARFDISVNSYSGEIGRGYGWEVLMPHTGRRMPLDAARTARKRFVNPNFDASIVPERLRIDPGTHFEGVVARYDKGIEQLPNTLQYDYCMTMMRCQRWYGRIASSTNQLWPCMSFFLLRTIIEPMLEADTASRRNSLLFRRVFAAVDMRLARHRLTRGYPPLPVTWRTLHRFWPLVPLYGGKVVAKLARMLRPAAPVADPESPRMRLWQDPEVQRTLDPATMRSIEVLDAQGLARFLERSKQPGFAHASQWSFLLTLECTLRRLHAVASEVRAAPQAHELPVG